MSTADSRKPLVERAIEGIAELIVKRPKRMLLVGFLLVAALLPGVGKVYQNIKYYIWFPDGDRKIEVLDEFEQSFGSDLASMLVVHSPSGIFDKDSAELLIELTDRMWKVSETIRVESLANFPWVHAEGDELIVEDLIPADQELTPELLAKRKEVALGHELLPGILVSKDGKTAVIYGWLQPTKTGGGENKYNDFVANTKDLEKIVADYKDRTDHEFHLAGFPVMEGYLEVYPPKEMQNLMPVILGTCVVFLFIFFRRASGVLSPLAVVVPAALGTLGVAGWLDIQINPMTITAPNIIIIVGISSTDQVLFTFFRALDSGMERKEAARYALLHALWPTFFSCVMIGVGFLSLVTMTIPPMQELGILVGCGTLIVWVLICCFVGPIIVLAPIKRRKRKGTLDITPEQLESASPRAIRLTQWIDRYKVAIVAGWVAVLALSGFLIINNKIVFDPIEWYAKGTDVRASLDHIRDHMGTSEAFEMLIDSGEAEGIKDPAFLKKVEALQVWLKSHKGVVNAASVVDIFKETNRALFGGGQEFYKLPDSRRGVADQHMLYTLNLPLGKNLNDRVTLDNRKMRVTVVSRLENSQAVIAFSEEIRAKAKELGLDIELTGRSFLYHQLNTYAVPSFFRSIVTGTIAIAIVLLIFFRSISLGALSLLTNFVPIVVGAGIILTLLGKSFDMATISTFVIALGVAVDDTVHFLDGYSRLRRQGFSARESISRLWSTVGPAMWFTTIVLTVCFGLFVLIEFPVLKYLGILISLILLVAFIADFILGPAIIMLWNRKDRTRKEG